MHRVTPDLLTEKGKKRRQKQARAQVMTQMGGSHRPATSASPQKDRLTSAVSNALSRRTDEIIKDIINATEGVAGVARRPDKLKKQLERAIQQTVTNWVAALAT